MELDAILAVVIGGTSLAGGKFSIVGSAIGALLIATLDKTVVFLGIPASATPAFKAIVIIVLVPAAVRAGALVGPRAREVRARPVRPRRPAADGARLEGGRRMSASRTLAEAVPPVPDLPESRNTASAASRCRGCGSAIRR